MDENKIRVLEESLANERMARKKTEEVLKQKSLDLEYKNEELEATKLSLSKIVNEKQIELNNLFKTIIDPYILMDLYGNVIKMNQASIDFFGVDNKEEPFNVMTTVHEDDVEYTRDAFQKFLEKGSFRNFQARLFNKQKELKWVDINCNVIYDTDGNPTLAQGIIRDITNQKKQQQVFNEQKNQLDVIVENSSLGIVLTKNGKILKSNTAFQNLLNYTEEELLLLTVADLSLKEDRKRSYKYMQKLDKGKINQFSIIKRYRTKHGKIIWAKTNVSGIKTNHKNIDYQVALIEDITEELHNQSLLKALNRLMSSILGKTNINDIAWEITANSANLLNFENCSLYLINYKTDKLQQIASYKENKKEVITINETVANHLIETGKSEIIDDISKDSRYLKNDAYLSEILIPIIASNEVIGIIYSKHSNKNFFTDHHLRTLKIIANLAATQLKNALNLQLLVKADKKNKALLKNLRQSNKELKDFAHVVSHDLKSPLRSMDALVNWIQEENAKSPNKVIEENIQLLLKKIDKMDHLINGILKYASIDQVNSSKRRIDLHELVKDLIDTIYIPTHITIHILDQLPELNVDKFRLHQLFQNLISNAIKYIDKEKGTITIRCIEKENFWEFSIEDNGMGIPEKYHQKIFEIFQTLGGNNDASTGVGLSIVKKIVDMYEGKIWLTSKENVGTTFYFTLPK
ncbi:PAS domain S-box protein [Tenacibaculum sp. TC6]|uniref:PAS domain S-box protein n=1 Tax=Tenacibaculum sp. TC6 TaxID=3423223 RepID=UPI003D361ACF